MNVILFDGLEWNTLLPLTFTRSVSDIRIGILTFTERWQLLLNCHLSIKTQSYLSNKYLLTQKEENIFINPAFFPNEELIIKIDSLKKGQAIIQNNEIIAFCSNELTDPIESKFNLESTLIHIVNPWDLFTNNKIALDFDFYLLTKDRISNEINSSNQIIGNSNLIFLEEGAQVNCSSLNSTFGPIYIDKDAEIMEGSMIRGGLSLGKNSKLNLGTKIYGSTSIGPNCKIGGEINNSIFLGYSNKAHDGFLGDSVIGEWCNLGAATTNSNLKNNYSNIKMWSFHQKKYIETGLNFCGLIMGDHSKSAINTTFNTGTSVGVFVNVLTRNFTEKYIPNFSWEGETREKYEFFKGLDTLRKVMKRRNKSLDIVEENILIYIYENY